MNYPEGSHVPYLLTFQIGALNLRILRECNKIFKESNLPLEMDQIPVILSLYYLNGGTQQEVAQRIQRDKSSVNRTISFLQKNELVKASEDANDKRKTIIELTATGKKIAKKASELLENLDKSVTEVLTVKEKEQFQDMLLKLIAKVSAL
ncbi:DNA-binding MarR family transcriptional regulator [Filimonas zeae]|nr:MarR family winged helix-turn-helix transcriptional regulator [Filimonas zeae]MDR6337717.1 DNA-binding MarR family transcriptional regulator [Filimonas zeae]